MIRVINTSKVSTFPLKKLCIDSIAKNFERFYFAFTESEDDNLQRDLDYLQRQCLEELAIALYIGNYLKPEYFPLFINEHLKFLDGSWFTGGHCFESMEDIFFRLPNLTRVRFFKEYGNEEVLKNVAKFCPKIVEIDVRFSKVTDNGVKYLYEIKNGTVSCPKLENIHIAYSRVTDRGVEALIQNLPSLKNIDHPDVPLVLHSIYTECFSKHQNIPYFHLVELDLIHLSRQHFYSNILKSCLTLCPKLESIICHVTSKDQLDCFNDNLKKAHLAFHLVNPLINIDSFLKEKGCNLTYLMIRQCSLSVSELAKNCPLLVELIFENVQFTNEDDQHVHFAVKDDQHVQVLFPTLLKCSFLRNVPPSERVFRLILSCSPKLESLYFENIHTLSLEMKHQISLWCKKSSVKSISFQEMNLETKFLSDILLASSSLKEMCLINCEYDDSDARRILQSLAKNLPRKLNIYFM